MDCILWQSTIFKLLKTVTILFPNCITLYLHCYCKFTVLFHTIRSSSCFRFLFSIRNQTVSGFRTNSLRYYFTGAHLAPFPHSKLFPELSKMFKYNAISFTHVLYICCLTHTLPLTLIITIIIVKQSMNFTKNFTYTELYETMRNFNYLISKVISLCFTVCIA